jgi:hypothetical protein
MAEDRPASCERPSRPRSSPCCGAPAWWNGWRLTHPVVAATGGGVERDEPSLRRAKCSSCRRSFTCYPSELYPRRQFQLDVVALAVAEVSLGGTSASAVARCVGASTTSVRRWTAWVAGLAEPCVLLGVAAHLDPDAPVGAGLSAAPSGSDVRACAGRVLVALEHLGMALVRCGVALAARSGLGRVLGWQHVAHGDVVGLVREPKTLSPAMALGGAPGSR